MLSWPIGLEGALASSGFRTSRLVATSRPTLLQVGQLRPAGQLSEQDCVENIVKNIAMWQDNGEEVLGDRLAQVKTRPESTPRTAAAEGAPLSVTKESKAGDS